VESLSSICFECFELTVWGCASEHGNGCTNFVEKMHINTKIYKSQKDFKITTKEEAT
jgi:hypothetical protein